MYCIHTWGKTPNFWMKITLKHHIRQLNADIIPVPIPLISRLHYLLELVLSAAMWPSCFSLLRVCSNTDTTVRTWKAALTRHNYSVYAHWNKAALLQMKAGVMCVICCPPAVLIMRIYYGTVDNECNVHALVGGIIHQVGQVAEAKDCNSIEPSSFQSSAQCTDGTRRTNSALLICQSPP